MHPEIFSEVILLMNKLVQDGVRPILETVKKALSNLQRRMDIFFAGENKHRGI